MSSSITIVHDGFGQQDWVQQNHLTTDASRVLSDAVVRTVSRGVIGRISPSAILWATLRWEPTLGVHVLRDCGANLKTMEEDVQVLLAGPSIGDVESVIDCQDLERVATTAVEEARGLGRDYVGTEHIVMALLRDEDVGLKKLFSNHGVSYEMYMARLAKI